MATTTNLSTLKINKLTQAQYDRELAAGNIDANALYLTPDEASSGGDYLSINNPTGTGSFSLNRKADTVIGEYSVAEGYNTTAATDYSHAEGYLTQVTADSTATPVPPPIEEPPSGTYGHAEGYGTVASGSAAHVEGISNMASGACSHAEGLSTVASSYYAHAEGLLTQAAGFASHAAGVATIANNFQYVVGKCNKDTIAPTSSTDTNANAGLFIVGIGAYDWDTGEVITRQNGFRINPAGKVYGTGTFGTTGADYAEYFEWIDGNPTNEDRRGYFVTLDGDKIRYATAEDDYILGVVSAEPAIAGDVHSESWHDMYLKDIYGSPIVDIVEVEEIVDKYGKVIPAHTERRWRLNPDYDSNAEYLSREQRSEWDAVGIVGKLVVIDDGTCQVNGYCYPNVDGIATASEEKTAYRVIARLDDTHVKVFIK